MPSRRFKSLLRGRKCKHNEAIHFSLILCVNDQVGIKTGFGIFNQARNESADFHR